MEIETNAKIVSETRQISERCVELVTKISVRKSKKSSLYMITSTGQDVEGGTHVDINPIASERADEEEEGMPGNPFVYVPPRVQMNTSTFSFAPPVQPGIPIAGHSFAPQQALPTPQPDKDGNRTFLEVSIPTFELVSRPIITPSKEILDKMEFTPGLTPVNDLFNDKLDYTCTTYDDLVRISKGMNHIYQKYEVFDEAPKVSATLRSFRDNYKRIEKGLQEAWKEIQDEVQDSAMKGVQDQVAKANEALRAAASLGAHYVRRDKRGLKPTVCPRCSKPIPPTAFKINKNNNATGINNGYNNNNSYVNCPNPQCGMHIAF